MITADGAVDADRWPNIVAVPDAPARAWVARRIALHAVRRAGVSLRLPDGSRRGDADNPLQLRVHSERLFHRLATDQRVGLGESYMAGEWSPGPDTDLGDLLTAFAVELEHLVPAALSRFRRIVEARIPHQLRNTRDGASSNIAQHYDLSNELFAAFLDETLTYSAAWFAGDLDAGWDDLAEAQRRKIDALLDRARVGDGTRLLEIGSGWGQLAIQAARRGATVETITLSREQQALAQQRVANAGVSDHVDVAIRDYRDVVGTFDAVVSVEMIEAVGDDYLPTYFRSVADALVPGGWFGLQAITMPHDRMLRTRDLNSWINSYVFPGGFVPSFEQIESLSVDAGMRVEEHHDLRGDYARTLQLWRERFVAATPTVAALGFDVVFRRMWELYLAYSEAGFRSGQLGDEQFAIRRT